MIKAALPKPRWVHRNRANTCDLAKLASQLAGDLLLFDLTVFPGHQAHDHERVVLFVAEANDRQQPIGDTLFQVRQQFLLRLTHVMIGELDRRTPWGAGRHDDDAPVFRRRQLLRQSWENHDGNDKPDKPKSQQQSGLVEGESEHAFVTMGQAIEHFFTGRPQAMSFRRFRAVSQPF